MMRRPLAEFARNITSQFGEDGIIAEILARIGTRERTCVEFGAWDGKYLSNTWDLWRNQGWRAILIEGDAAKHAALNESLKAYPAVMSVHAFVTADGADCLDQILLRTGAPQELDVLSIDIDGDEYYVWKNLTQFHPRIVVVEYNPTIPPELDLVQVPGAYFGASARALTRLAHEKGYGLACCTETNCIFVARTEFGGLGIDVPRLEDVFPRRNLTYVVNAYDGAMYLTRNPTYSPCMPVLSVSTLGGELSRVLRPDPAKVPKTVAHGAELTPVRIFEIRGDSDPRPLWRRVLSRGARRLAHLSLGAREQMLLDRWTQYRADRRSTENWINAGRPVPPPHSIKRRVLREYANRQGLRIFVETGTYLGDMVEAMRRRFREVFSIELSPVLYRRACQRFAVCRNVHIVEGDSATALPRVLENVKEPALFWLDGHYSEGITAKGEKQTPILNELDAVFRHGVKGHAILIDDARCFDGTGDYPTLVELERFVRERWPDASFEVRDDIVRIA